MSVSYARVNFKNRVVERPRTYIITTNGDGSVTLTPAFGEVEESGVPLNAENLNKMDKGTYDCAEAINGLEISVTLLGQSVQSAEQDIDGLREDLTNDEAAIGDNAREINALKTRTDTAEGNILALAQNDANVARDLTTKQAAIEENASQINQLKTRVDAAETNIGKKQDKLTFDSAPTAGSNNPVTSKGIKAALDAKQGSLTFDSTPTANSANPVTSGGTKAALDLKADKASPTFTGTPKAPTAASGTNTTQIATTAFVQTALTNKVKSFTASIPKTGWTSMSSGAYYTINLTVSGILATDTPDIGIVQTGTWSTDETMRDAWACITRIVASAANTLTITASEIPSVAIPIQIRCIR